MNIYSILLTGTLMAGSIGATAFGMNNNQSEPKQTTQQSIDQMKAIEIALGQTKGGMVTKSKIEEEHGLKTYEINILKQNEEFEVEINAANGEVLDLDREIKGKDEDVPQDATPTISVEDVKKTALEQVKGDIKEVELDFEGGKLVYEVELITADQHEIEVTVNADNGNVISVVEDED